MHHERKTLVNVYNLVTRSLFDFSSPIESSLSDPVLGILNVVQNVALRAITHSHFNKSAKRSNLITKVFY